MKYTQTFLWTLADKLKGWQIMRREMKIMLKRDKDKRKIGRVQGAYQRPCNQISFSLAFVLFLFHSGFVLSFYNLTLHVSISICNSDVKYGHIRILRKK